jgi:ElaA protein
MTIHTTSFRHLDIETLYDILQLRSEVFVVEQDCVYQDLDGIDKKAMHSWIAEDGKMVAYARFFMKNERRKIVQIGRVVVAKDKRRERYASFLMRSVMENAGRYFGAKHLYLESQTYAIPFYERLGFKICSEEFLEDGIPHVKMERDV